MTLAGKEGLSILTGQREETRGETRRECWSETVERGGDGEGQGSKDRLFCARSLFRGRERGRGRGRGGREIGGGGTIYLRTPAAVCQCARTTFPPTLFLSRSLASSSSFLFSFLFPFLLDPPFRQRALDSVIVVAT